MNDIGINIKNIVQVLTEIEKMKQNKKEEMKQKKIELIKIDNNGVLQESSFETSEHLNIITGANGSGKTSLLQSIVNQYQKEYNIKSIFASIHHFKAHAEIQQYINIKTTTTDHDFKQEYTTITNLTDNRDLINDCNNFFQALNIPTRLNIENTESGWLLFNNPNYNSKTTITLDKISPSERAIFLLWLLTKNNTKFSVLILDDFDNHFDKVLLSKVYAIIIDEFVDKRGVQVFIATNRKIVNLNTKQKQFKIENCLVCDAKNK